MELLAEGKRDRQLETYLQILRDRGIEISLSQLKQALLHKFESEAGIQNLSLDSNYYLAGVARYYFNGDLTTNKRINILYPNVKDNFDNDVCKRLNELILILRNAYIDSVGTQFEQPEDFGELSIKKLLRKYNKKINDALGIAPDKEKKQKVVSDDYTAGNDYTYEILYSYNDARKYYEATRPGAWCITYGENHYDYYTNSRHSHFIIFRKNGFENVKRKKGPGFTTQKPHDEYGNSLIAFLQKDDSPRADYITSRWNHGSYDDNTSGIEADHAYTTEEFLNIVGCDNSLLERIYEQWKDKTGYVQGQGTRKNMKEINAEKLAALRKFKYVQMLINNGMKIEDLEKNDEYNLYLSPISCLYQNDEDPNELKTYSRPHYIALSVGNKTYYSFLDRKKIFFDKILMPSDKMYRHDHKVTDKILDLQPCGASGYKYLFDMSRHDFIVIDGKYKFKDLSTRPKKDYCCVAISSNQYALINLNTGKPVRAKNGSPWFEKIEDRRQYGRGISLPSLYWPYVHMVYDSSANDVYLYNMDTNSFIDFDKDYTYIDASYETTFIELVTRDFEKRCYIDPNTNKKLNILGHENFTYIKNSKLLGIIAFKIPGEMWQLYDTQTNSILKIDGKELMIKNLYSLGYFGQNEFRSFGRICVGIHSLEKTTYLTEYFFNTKTRKLVRDDISGYRFCPKAPKYCPTLVGGRVCVMHPNQEAFEGKKILTLTPGNFMAMDQPLVPFRYLDGDKVYYMTKTQEEDTAEQGLQVEAVKRNFWNILNKLNKHTLC